MARRAGRGGGRCRRRSASRQEHARAVRAQSRCATCGSWFSASVRQVRRRSSAGDESVQRQRHADQHQHGDEHQGRVIQPTSDVDQEAQPLSAPTNSPTTAPITASVAPIFNPPKSTGSDAGTSSLAKICRRVARSERISWRRSSGHRAHTDHGVDQHREEDDQGGRSAPWTGARPEPDDQQRGNGDHGDRLRGDDVGRQQAFDGR